MFPMEPLEAVEAALASGDPEAVMAAAEGLGNVFATCHAENQQKVRAKYHWPSFQSVRLLNPLNGQEEP